MGKGSRRRNGDDAKAYRKNLPETPEWKKQTDCWKCNISFKCDMRYKQTKCPLNFLIVNTSSN